MGSCCSSTTHKLKDDRVKLFLTFIKSNNDDLEWFKKKIKTMKIMNTTNNLVCSLYAEMISKQLYLQKGTNTSSARMEDNNADTSLSKNKRWIYLPFFYYKYFLPTSYYYVPIQFNFKEKLSSSYRDMEIQIENNVEEHQAHTDLFNEMFNEIENWIINEKIIESIANSKSFEKLLEEKRIMNNLKNFGFQ